MGFASSVKGKVTIGEDTYNFHKLSWKSLEKAEQARQIAQAQTMRAMGGDLVKALRSEALNEAAASLAAKRETVEGRRKERYEKYDREEVLVGALEGWSLEDKLSRESIVGLDPETADELHRAILDLSLAPLDADEAEGKAEVGSGASISS